MTTEDYLRQVGETPYEAAIATGMSTQVWRQYFSGSRRPGPRACAKIAKVLGKPAKEVMDFFGTKPPEIDNSNAIRPAWWVAAYKAKPAQTEGLRERGGNFLDSLQS